MSFDRIFIGGNISATGLAAERHRMEVVANNIANANSTRSAEGGPYRRREVLFEAMLGDDPMSPQLHGVRVVGDAVDESPLPSIYQPGHPDADAQGMVTMPNVVLPIEMVNLITANRAYEANLKAMQAYRQMLEQTLNLLR